MAYAPAPPGCTGCPARAAGGVSYVPGTGPRTARYALIGQGPGETEAHAHTPFCGPAGWKLDHWLTRAGLRRHEAWVDNVVRCWLPKNRPPRTAEVAHCLRVHVYPDLRRLSALVVVVPIGVPAMKALIRPGASERTAGTFTTIEVPDAPSDGSAECPADPSHPPVHPAVAAAPGSPGGPVGG